MPDMVTTAHLKVPAAPVQIGSIPSFLATIPHLLGFHPERSIVIVGADVRGRVRITMRYDLPKPARARSAGVLARHALAIISAQAIQYTIVAGYGPKRLVDPVIDALRREAPHRGIEIREMVRAEGGRYWSYVCQDPQCCSPDGIPYDASDCPAAFAAAEYGAAQVLPSREALADTIAAAGGEEGESMRKATRAAENRAARLAIRVERDNPNRKNARHAFTAAGVKAADEAIELYRGGERFPSHSDAAWLAVMLHKLAVRDHAWARMDPTHLKDHLRLWADLTATARPGHVAAPASLLAFVAWQAGDGALANVALDRALADNPRYSMAGLLRSALDCGAPPSVARLPLTPEEVAASYAERDEDEHSDGDQGADADGDAEDEDRDEDSDPADDHTSNASAADSPGNERRDGGLPADGEQAS